MTELDESERKMESALMKHLNNRKRARDRQRGITLIELLVVLSILALISALVVVNVLPERDRAAARKAKIDIGSIENALDQYRLDMFAYPTTEQGLEALVTIPPGEANTDQYRPGGYLRTLPVDPWGRPYQYRQPGEHGPIDVYSLGADGEPGGEGVKADIANWSQAK